MIRFIVRQHEIGQVGGSIYVVWDIELKQPVELSSSPHSALWRAKTLNEENGKKAWPST